MHACVSVPVSKSECQTGTMVMRGNVTRAGNTKQKESSQMSVLSQSSTSQLLPTTPAHVSLCPSEHRATPKRFISIAHTSHPRFQPDFCISALAAVIIHVKPSEKEPNTPSLPSTFLPRCRRSSQPNSQSWPLSPGDDPSVLGSCCSVPKLKHREQSLWTRKVKENKDYRF